MAGNNSHLKASQANGQSQHKMECQERTQENETVEKAPRRGRGNTDACRRHQETVSRRRYSRLQQQTQRNRVVYSMRGHRGQTKRKSQPHHKSFSRRLELRVRNLIRALICNSSSSSNNNKARSVYVTSKHIHVRFNRRQKLLNRHHRACSVSLMYPIMFDEQSD